MKLISYNIQAAIGTNRPRKYLTHAHRQVFNASSKQKTLAKIGGLISDYDFACMQEVDLGGRRSGFSNQVEALEKVSGHEHSAAQENRRVGRISRHGNAILSKYPLENVRDIKLPGRVRGRGALIVDVEAETAMTIACLHLSLGAEDQFHQLKAVGKEIDWARRVIVCGDLNCTHASKPITAFCNEHSAFIQSGALHKTYPAW